MPIYEYQCDHCGHRLEIIQKVNDAPLQVCPQCKQEQLRKLVSAATFRLKGSGWYETDFKKDSRKRLADSGDKGESDKSGSDAPAPAKSPSVEPKSEPAKSKQNDSGSANPG